MSADNAIEIKNLSKRFDGFSLRDITLTLPKGCIMGLIGENGAGKSTTIRLIMNALQADGGTVRVLGQDNRQPSFVKLKEEIGVVLDEANFPAVLNIREMNRIMRGIFSNWDEGLYFQYIAKFELPHRRAFKDFSRGMKMKLAIAVALAHHPKLLILDEATGGLDPIVREEVLNIFYDYTRDPDHTVLISSHILSDLEKLCDYIAFLHKGRLLFCKEKDLLLEEFGVLRCGWKDLDDIPREAVFGRRSNPYGVECLVKRDLINAAFPVETASIEDIILLMVKGDKLC